MALLAFFRLQVPADHDIEELIRAADFDIGADDDRVPSLHDRVLEFVGADGERIFHSIAEVLALEHLLESDAAIEADDFFVSHFAKPIAVEDDFGFFFIEDFESLFLVGGGVREDGIAGELRAGGGASARVADHGGEVADDEDGVVAEVLELAEFGEADGVAEVDIWGGGIDTHFDAEGALGSEFGGEFFLAGEEGAALGEDSELFGRRERCG